MWFNFNKLVENCEIIIKDEDNLRKQICNRYYKLASDNVAQLESKQQARAKGRKSPDRADALVLCFHKYITPRAKKFKQEKQKHFSEILSNRKSITVPTLKNLVEGSKVNEDRKKYFNKSGIILATRESINASRNEIALELKQAMENLREKIRNN